MLFFPFRNQNFQPLEDLLNSATGAVSASAKLNPYFTMARRLLNGRISMHFANKHKLDNYCMHFFPEVLGSRHPHR